MPVVGFVNDSEATTDLATAFRNGLSEAGLVEGAIRLYGDYGNYACRFCCRAQYLSQKQKTASRKRLSAAKLRLKLGGWPDIREPMPSKPKWTRRRTYQRIRNQIQALEAQANQTRFRKDIDIRTFAYHVA
jgi:hypothetical protein